MTLISLIVAVDERLGIGKENKLLCHLPADLKHFKQMTLGKPIIMGRKTFESIGKALPGRINIVLSHHDRLIEGVTVVQSLEEAIELVKDEPEIMVIGGSHVFQEALTKAQRIYLTMIHHVFDADVFFPDIDLATWGLTKEYNLARDEKNEYDMTFRHYDRR